MSSTQGIPLQPRPVQTMFTLTPAQFGNSFGKDRWAVRGLRQPPLRAWSEHAAPPTLRGQVDGEK